MRTGVAQGGLISPVLFSLYVKDLLTPSHHFDLDLYVEDTAIIATSRMQTLLVSYLYSKLNDLQRWLSEWIIAINLLKPNDVYICRTAALTSILHILKIYSTNIHTEYFKHAA